MTKSRTARQLFNVYFSTPSSRILLSMALLVLLLFGVGKAGLAIKNASIQSMLTGAKSKPLNGKQAVIELAQEGTLASLQNAFAEAHAPQSSLPQAILLADDGAMEDQFGTSVALSGDTAVIGTWFADIGENTNQGAAYVFVRNGQTWTLQQKLTANDGLANDGFGFSVAISNDTIAVTSPSGDTPPDINTGAVYVFVRSGMVWTLQQRFTASPITNQGFGFSVAISGDSLVVGATTEDNVGSAYVFLRNGGTWSQQQHIVVPGVVASARIGRSVSIDGDSIVLGAPNDLTGKVYPIV